MNIAKSPVEIDYGFEGVSIAQNGNITFLRKATLPDAVVSLLSAACLWHLSITRSCLQ